MYTTPLNAENSSGTYETSHRRSDIIPLSLRPVLRPTASGPLTNACTVVISVTLTRLLSAGSTLTAAAGGGLRPPLPHRGILTVLYSSGGSVAEWLACWTQVSSTLVQIAAATLSGNSLRQTVHTHGAFVHQAAKLVAALLRVARVAAGLAESNGSLPPGL